ncbi:MAG: amidohydrolase [Dehalococcoidia bacterium]|nr:amidohydrolase [Dehalococcoidia bacterium]
MSYSADLILKNANVITTEPAQPRAELIAIKGDRILLAGVNDALEQVIGAGTRVIDCEGKTVLPGFNDAHCHVFSMIRQLSSIDLSPASVRSIADIKSVIRRNAQNTLRGRWLSGTGYNEFYLAEKRHPNRRDLDEVAPEHPVVLAQRTLHACVLNSMALRLAGIAAESEAPPGGLIERDPSTGEPTGVLYEMLGYIRRKVTPPLSENEIAQGMTLANRHYLSLGITSVQEATVTNNLEQWHTFRKFKDRLKPRLYMMLGAEAQQQFPGAGMVTGSGDSDLRAGAVKIVLSEATGRLRPSQAELNGLVLSAHRAGFQVAMHAFEISVIEAAITALENIGEDLSARRHRIEHCSVCPPHLVKRLSKLKAVVASQPPFVFYSGERYLAQVPADEQKWLYPFKSLLDSGVIVAASSDSPIVPDNPLTGIFAAVTRQAETGQKVAAHEAVSVHQALAMYTTSAAHASFEEGIKGSIAPGKLADLVVLSADPTNLPPEQIKDIKVEMTILGGEVVWER